MRPQPERLPGGDAGRGHRAGTPGGERSLTEGGGRRSRACGFSLSETRTRYLGWIVSD